MSFLIVVVKKSPRGAQRRGIGPGLFPSAWDRIPYARVSINLEKRGVDLISDVLPFGRLWYGEPNAVSNAIGYAMHSSRSHDAVIRVYDAAGNVIEKHEHKADFKEP